MKHKSRCSCCHDWVSDISKRFDAVLGFTCVECHEFSARAEKRLRKVGIEGCAVIPLRFAPTPNPETQP